MSRRLGVALLAVLAALPVSRLVGSSPPPRPVIALLLAYCAMSAMRPWSAWLVLCGVFPLASMITVIARLPWQSSQTALCLCLTFLTGWLVHAARTGTPLVVSRLALPCALFSSLAIASAVTTSLVMSAGAGESAASTLKGLAAVDLLRSPSPDEPAVVAFHTLVAIGILASASMAAKSGFGAATARMIVFGLAAAAMLNVTRFLQIVFATGEPWTMASRYGRWIRINVHYADVNAAGSTFALAFVAAIGQVLDNRRFVRVAFALCGGTLLLALWLAGSRVALASTALATAIVALAQQFPRRSTRGWWLFAGSLVVAALVIAAWMIVRFPRVQANTDPSSALAIRMELLARTQRMVRDAPILGIGIGRFFPESVRYSSPRSFGPENSHNIFAQVTAELGLVGLASFIWLVGSATAPLAKAVRRGLPTVSLWTCGGVLAYVLSGMAGHPLIVFEAAVPFWMALGALAGSEGGVETSSRPSSLWLRRGVCAAAILLIVSIPIRADQFKRWRHLHEVANAAWEFDGTIGYRDVGDRDLIFVSPHLSSIVLPMKLSGSTGRHGEVLVTLDGVPANRFVVAGDAWRRFRVPLPPVERYGDRRLELKLEGAAPGVRLLVGRVTLEK